MTSDAQQQFADHGHGVLAIVCQDALGDPAVTVVAAYDLLAVVQGGRVLLRGEAEGAS